jgi:hypothetical protein
VGLFLMGQARGAVVDAFLCGRGRLGLTAVYHLELPPPTRRSLMGCGKSQERRYLDLSHVTQYSAMFAPTWRL